ncbi:hypothetical protein ACFL2H_12630, partial [Planctomycetota bacterium]
NSPGEFLQKVLGHLVDQAEKNAATASEEPHVPSLPKDVADAGFRLHPKTDTRFIGRDPISQELVHRTEVFAFCLIRNADEGITFYDIWGQQRSQAHLTVGTLDIEKLTKVARAIVSSERHQAEVNDRHERARIERDSVIHTWPPTDGTAKREAKSKAAPLPSV